jgi:CheY-like chemotaxis protein
METSPLASPPVPPIVLIVEDDVDTREMYHAALEFDGFWVVGAPLASEAIVQAAEIKPDIIVTDLSLTGSMDGLSLAERLRSDARTAAIPLVAVTGRDPHSLGEHSALFEEVLLKPVLPDVLSQKIQETLEASAVLRRRSAAATAKVPHLLARSQQLLVRSQRVGDRARRQSAPPRCPKCGAALAWTERRKLRGVSFDYYRPCENGCGIFCYNVSERRFVPLA